MARHGDGLLAESGVRHEQDFARLRDAGDHHELLHHGGVDLESSGGIDDEKIGIFIACLFERTERDAGDVPDAFLRVDRDADLAAEHFQLFDRGGTVHVACREQDLFPFVLEVQRELGAGGRLAGTVQTDHEDDVRMRPGVELRFGGSHELDEFVVDDLDRLLSGGDALHDGFAEAGLPDFGNELVGDLDIDVGVDQGVADVLHGFCDIGFGNGRLAAELAEDFLEFVGKIFKHFTVSCALKKYMRCYIIA